MQSKTELRKLIKQHLKSMSEDASARVSDQIWRSVEALPEFISSQNVVVYWSLPTEVGTHGFVEKWAGIKNVYLPVVDGDNLRLVRFLHKGQLVMNARFKILEPTGDELLDLSLVDIVIVPGLAFDSNGNRMGRGAGYYDRFLPKLTNAQRIGVAYKCQMADDLPIEAHDVPMHKVVWGAL